MSAQEEADGQTDGANVPIKPPAPLTGTLINLDITGCLFPAHGDRRPVLLQIEGAGDDLFLPVFSTTEKLVDGMQLAATSYSRIIQITNERAFLDSLEESTLKLRVIVDPYKHESGTLRFREVIGAS